MIVRPKVLLDTNVYIDVDRGNINAQDWGRAVRWIRNRCRYCVSFPTLKELLCGLARGADEHFEANKQPLRALKEPGRPNFLPYPSVFALRTVLGLRSIARVTDTYNLSEETANEIYLEAVLDAPTKAHLKLGIPMRGRGRYRAHWFDLDRYCQHENAPQEEHVQLLQGISDGTINQPDPINWAGWILYYHREQLGDDAWLDQDKCKKLVSALDAAYKYEETLAAKAKDPQYNSKKRITAWGDVMQLFYLCDPHVRIVTKEGKWREYTEGSSQSSQIVLWDEFLDAIPAS